MAANGRAEFTLGIKTKTDLSGIKQLQKELQIIQNLSTDPGFFSKGKKKEIQEMTNAASQLQRALTSAFDTDTGTLNMTKFTQSLKNANLDLMTIKKQLHTAGAVGDKAFISLAGNIMQVGKSAKVTNEWLDKMSQSFINTARWTATSAVINGITSSISQAYSYTVNLDKSLNSIRIVTGKNADEMERFASEANKAAKALSVSTRDYTEGSLIYYQQGLDDQTVKTLTDVTAKASNVTGQSMSTVSEQLTAVWNGYQAANQAAAEGMAAYEGYVDKMSAVGASTASNLEEISTAMSKVASTANALGVDFDQLNAQIATIVSATRQAPENVGTALKTIYARISDIEAGTDEAEVSLGEYTQGMANLGFSVLNSQGQLRDLGEVIEEIGGGWKNLTREQQISLAQTMAGTRQYNNLIALFDSWDQYQKSLNVSMNATGTLERQQAIYAESLAAKTQKLRTSYESLYDALFNVDSIGGTLDALSEIASAIAKITDAFGGLDIMLPALGAIITRIFSVQLGGAGLAAVTNIKNAFSETASQATILDDATKGLNEYFKDIAEFEVKEEKIYQKLNDGQTKLNESLQVMVDLYKAAVENQGILTEDQKKQINAIIQSGVDAAKTGVDKDSAVKDLVSTRLGSTIYRTKIGTRNVIMSPEEITGAEKDRTASLQQAIAAATNTQVHNYQGKYDQNFSKIKDTTQKAFLKEYTNNFIQAIQASNKNEKGENIISEATIRKYLKGKLQNIDLSSPEDLKKLRSGIYEELVKETAGKKNAIKANASTKREISNWVSGEDGIKSYNSILSTKDQELKQKAINEYINSMSSSLGNQGFDQSNIKESLQDFFKDINTEGKTAEEVIDEMSDRLGELTGQAGKVRELTEAEKEQAAAAAKAAEEQKKMIDAQARAQAITSLVSAFSAGVQVFNTVTSVWDQMEDGSLTLADGITRLTSVVMTLTFIVPQLAKALETLTFVANGTPWAWGIMGAVALIAGLVKASETLGWTVKAAKKNAQEAINAYDDQISKIKELQNEYDTTRQRILELQEIAASGSLSTVEQEELAMLEAKNLQLQTQLDIEKEIAKVRAQDAAKNIQKAEKKDSNIYDFRTDEEFFNPNSADFNYAQSNFSNQTRALLFDENSENKPSKISTNDTEGFKSIIDSINNDIENQTDKELRNYMYQYRDALIAGYRNQLASEFNENKSSFDTLVLTGDRTSNAYKSLSAQNYNYYTTGGTQTAAFNQSVIKATGLSEKEITEAIKDQSSDSAKILQNTLDQYGVDIEQFIKGINTNDIAGYFKEIENGAVSASSTVKNNIGTLSESISKLAQGEQLSLETLSQLEARYPELARIRSKGSQDYLDALEVEREKEEEKYKRNLEQEIALNKQRYEDAEKLYHAMDSFSKDVSGEAVFDGLKEEFSNKDKKDSYESYFLKYKDTINKKLNRTGEDVIENFEQMLSDSEFAFELKAKIEEESKNEMIASLEAVFDREYKLQWSITDDLVSDAENITNMAKNAAKAVELIGDGFKLAAKDADELFAIFPELASQAQVLADGTIQLNDEVVSAVLGGNAARIDSDNAVAANAIQNRINDLEIQKQEIQSKLDSLANSAEQEIDLQEFLGDSYDLFAEEQAKTDDASAKAQAEASGGAAAAMIQNWAAVEKAAIDYATTANQAANAGLTGNAIPTASVKDASQYGITFDPVGNGGAVGALAAATEENTKKTVTLTEELKEKLKTFYTNQLQATEEQIAALTSAWAKMNAGVQGIEDAALGDGGSKSEKDLKIYDKEFDRYKEINDVLKKINVELQDLDDLQSHLHGQQLINSLKKENDLLNQQRGAYEKLYEAQREQVGEFMGTLEQYGAQFDSKGELQNYEEVTKAELEKYNNAVMAYNAGLLDEAAFAVIEKSYETFKETIENYETLYYDTMQSTIDALEKIHYKQLENNLKAWETELEIKLDLSKAKRQWADFVKDINKNFKLVYKEIDKDIENLLTKATSYTENGGTIWADIDAVEQVRRELINLNNGGKSDMFASASEAEKKVKELQDTLSNDAKDLYKMVEDVWDAYIEGIDQAKDKFDDLLDKFEYLNDTLEYQGQLIELIYGEEAYGLIGQLNAAQSNLNLAQAASLQQQVQFWDDMRKTAQEANEDYSKYYENMINAQKQLNSLITEQVKLLQNDLVNSYKEAINLFENKTFGSSIDKLKDKWQKAKEWSDKYYDNIERGYETEMLANKWRKAIRDTSDLKMQQKLNDVMGDELDKLNSKKYLREYDIELSEKELAIYQARIALEDAQKSKNSMKLVRGQDGNWNYSYVADEDDIEEKENALFQSVYDRFEFVKNHVPEIVDEIHDAEIDFKEFWMEIANDFTLSQDEKAEKLNELIQHYLGEDGVLTLLYGEYHETVQTFDQVTEEAREELFNQGAEVFEGTTIMMQEAQEILQNSMNTSWEEITEYINDAYESAIDANGNYENVLNELQDVAGVDFGNIQDMIGDTINFTNMLKDATSQLTTQASNDLGNFQNALSGVEAMWYRVKDAIMEAMKSALAFGEVDTRVMPNIDTIYSKASGLVDKYKSIGGESGYASNNAKGDYYYMILGDDTDKAWAGYSTTGQFITRNKVDGKTSEQEAIKTIEALLRSQGYNPIRKFDTGGYTGSWDSSGKLAVLHQKELVLNADDTENMLETVSAVRDIASIGDSIRSAVANTIAKLVSNILKTDSNSITNNNSHSESMVIEKVECSFPNATNADEIQNAIMTLPNIASQWANRKQR